MKEKGITQYDLYNRYNINRSQLNRFLFPFPVSTITNICQKVLTNFSIKFYNTISI